MEKQITVQEYREELARRMFDYDKQEAEQRKLRKKKNKVAAKQRKLNRSGK